MRDERQHFSYYETDEICTQQNEEERMRRVKKERLFELFEFYSLFDLSEIRDHFADQH